MDRRAFVKGALAASLVPLTSSKNQARANSTDATDPYPAILERVLVRSPESASSLGLDLGPHAALKHRLDDRSPENRLSYFQALIDSVPVLRGASPTNSSQAIFRSSALWFAESASRFRAFPYGGIGVWYPAPYTVSQVAGAYWAVPELLTTYHAIADREDAEAYLDRLTAFATAIDQDTDHARADAARGVAPPAVILERTIAQLNSFELAQRGANAGLVTLLVRHTAEKGIGGDWSKHAQAIVDGPIAAAIARQLTLMQTLRRSARTSVGVDRLSDGEAYYAACLRFHTSTALTPTEVHALGLEQVADLTARARTVLNDVGMRGGSVSAQIRSLMSDPKYLYPNDDAGRAALLDYISTILEDITRRLPRDFSRLPRTQLEVRRVPVAIELGAPGAYALSGSVDGSRPSTLYFNLHNTAEWPKWIIPSTAYHEGIPGHHFQGSLANEASGIPTLFKLLDSTAFSEGWALYAEQLADELGAYDANPLGRIGMLRNSLFRACRLVVDTGLHAQGWSRERAITYLTDTAAATPDDARREVERYISWPGQACAYKIGQLEILRLRERARTGLGDRFDLRNFHETVLSCGSPPLEVLAGATEAWMARTRDAPNPAMTE